MQIHFAPDQNYDCIQCGRSCQAGWDIPVEAEVISKIKDHPLTLRVIQDRGAALLQKGDQTVLNMTPDNPRCGYLETDLLCGLHRHLGVDSKPTTCRLFPLIITRAPDGYHLGVSYSCSAVRENKGRPLSAQAEQVETLVKLGAMVNSVPADGIPVHGPWFSDYEECRQIEDSLISQGRQIGYRRAIAAMTSALGHAFAALPKPRNQAPRPLPVETLPTLLKVPPEWADPVIEKVPDWLWVQMAPALGPELASVEPGLRSAYHEVAAGLQDLSGDALHQKLRQPLPAEVDREIERYLVHLIARKQLLLHPTLLASLCMLHYLPYFLTLFSHGFAEQRQRPVHLDDYYDALDLCEKFLVYHCRGLRPLYQRVARTLVEHLRPTPPEEPA